MSSHLPRSASPSPRITIRVKGLEVAPGYVMQPAEPDVGIFRPYAEVYELRVKRRGKWEIAPWLEKSLSPAQWDRVVEDTERAHQEADWDYARDYARDYDRYGEG